jgi:GAF domain-containing protein/anti-anti-sigma regulatory factor
MNDVSKTQAQLVDELARMHSRVAELEAEVEQAVTEAQQKTAQSERRLAELTIVNEIGQAISSATKLNDVLEEVRRRVDRLFDTANFCVSLYEEESDEWANVLFVEGGQVLPRSDIHHKGGTGLTGCMIRDRQSLLFRSEEEIAAFQKARGMESIGKSALSWLGVPLVVADKVVGGMAIQSYEQANLYDEQDEVLFRTIAVQVASALNNLRLLEETQQRAEELAVLNELGQALTACLSVEEVLDEAYRQIARLVDATNLYIALYNPEKDEIAFVIDIEEGTRRPYRTRRSGQGLTEYVIRNRTPVLIPENVAEWIEEEMGTEAIGRLALSWLGVPLIIGDQVLGMVTVQSYTAPRLYDEHDRDLLTAIASQTAIAIHNARLFEEAHIRAEELAVLNELGRILTTRLSVEEVLDETHRQTSRLLDATNFYMGLYDSDKHQIAFLLDATESEIDRRITTISADQGLAGYIVRNRESVMLLDDVSERLVEIGVEPVGEIPLSFMGVPLVTGDRVLGVMGIQSFISSYAYDEHDLEVLTAIASQVAIALQNAQLYEAVEQELAERKRAEEALKAAYSEVEKQVEERTSELQQEIAERERAQAESLRLQQEVIAAQKEALRELSTPIIPVIDRIIVMPLIGSIDSMRARDITRVLLAGIREHRAKVVILDITGVPLVDSGVVSHLNKTIQAARLKGARTIVTGISDAVAETIVDLGIDWGGVETVADLQTGLIIALESLGINLTKQ